VIIDIRYHIASLAAVFIALGIGILVGSLINGDDFLVRQQHHLITMLENDVRKIMVQKEDLVTQISSLQNSNELMQKFVDIVSSGIVNDVLRDKIVSLMFVTCNIDESLVKGIEGLVKMAGGSLGTVCSFGGVLDVSVDTQALYALLGLPAKSSDAEFTKVIREIGRGVTGGADLGLVTHMLENGFLTVSGDSSIKPDVLILIANSSGRQYSSTKIDNALFEGARDCGVRVVAAEVSTAKQTYLAPYIQHAVSTVDNVETHFGRLALILVAAGVDGNFGVRKTVSAFFPDITALRTLSRRLEDE
jgi:hypothetical protein